MEKSLNAFQVRKTYKGQKGFEKDYIDRKIYQVVEKTGPNEYDFVLKLKVIDKKKPIKDVVSLDKDSVGVYNVLRSIIREHGQEYADAICNRGTKYEDVINDVSGMPDNLMDAHALMDELKKIYSTLPAEITKGKDVLDFFSKVSKDDLHKFYGSKYDAIIKSEQEKKNKINNNENIKKDIKEENK